MTYKHEIVSHLYIQVGYMFLCIRTSLSKRGNADSCDSVYGKYSISRENPASAYSLRPQSAHQGMTFCWMTDKDLALYAFWMNN